MRYKVTVSYDGTNYQGFQIQNDLPTIELEIKKAFQMLINEDVKIYPSGRTDKGVHAKGQVFHFDTEKELTPLAYIRGLNTYLPSDIHILNVEIVDSDFHARFSCVKKEYRYYIKTDEYDVFTRNYAPYIKGLDFEKMAEACHLFEGKHNFRGFCSAQVHPRKDFVKTIYNVNCYKRDNYIEIDFIGTGFLKYQIRRMMGLLIDIGLGKANSQMILEVLEKEDPKISHRVAPACGLYLYEVSYKNE